MSSTFSPRQVFGYCFPQAAAFFTSGVDVPLLCVGCSLGNAPWRGGGAGGSRFPVLWLLKRILSFCLSSELIGRVCICRHTWVQYEKERLGQRAESGTHFAVQLSSPCSLSPSCSLQLLDLSGQAAQRSTYLACSLQKCALGYGQGFSLIR